LRGAASGPRRGAPVGLPRLLGEDPQVRAVENDLAGGQGGHQVAAWQVERGAGGLGGHAGGERVLGAEGGDGPRQLGAQPGPVLRVGEPVPRDRVRLTGGVRHGEAGRGQLRPAQQLVPAQQVGRRRGFRPRAKLAGRGGAGAPAGERRRERVEDGRTVDRQAGGTRVAQDQPVADVQRQRLLQPQAGVDRVGPEQADPGLGARRPHVHEQVGRELRVRVVRRGCQANVELAGEGPAAWLDEGHAARGEVGGDAAQVERDPGDAADLVGGLAERLEAAHPDGAARRREDQLLAVPDRARGQGAGDDGAGAPDRERPVDPQPDRGGPRIGGMKGPNQADERLVKPVEALAGHRADGDRLDGAQAGPRDLGAGLAGRWPRVGQVGAGDDEQAVPDTEGVHGGQVLGGLRHPAAVGRHDEHDGGDRPEAGEHVRDEALMARDIDEGQHLPRRPIVFRSTAFRGTAFRGTVSRGQGHPGVAEVDGHAPAAFLRPAVRLHPGEGADQRGLPVVHVPSGRYDVHQSPALFARSRGCEC
jgi:hypothetical protein